MTKNGKITAGIVAGVVVLGGIGALTNTDKDTPNSLLESEISTSAIIEETTEKTTITTTEETAITTKEETTTGETTAQIITQTTAAITTERKANVVYIAASGNGTKYHASKTCSGMDGNVIEMSREEAEAAGYTPCQKNSCYK